MDIPKIITQGNNKYKLIKEYPTYVLYENIEYGYKVTFHKHDLGLIKEIIKPPKTDVNPENVKI